MAAKSQVALILGHAAALRSTAESFVQQMQGTADSLEALAKSLQAGEPAAGAKGEKRKRKKQDPNAPKKAMSAFFLYCKARRAENPGIKLSPALLTEEWSAMDAEAKKVRAPALAGPLPPPLPLTHCPLRAHLSLRALSRTALHPSSPRAAQPHVAKAAKLKEKRDAEVTAYRLANNIKPAKAAKLAAGAAAGGGGSGGDDLEEEDEEEEEEDDEEEEVKPAKVVAKPSASAAAAAGGGSKPKPTPALAAKKPAAAQDDDTDSEEEDSEEEKPAPKPKQPAPKPAQSAAKAPPQPAPQTQPEKKEKKEKKVCERSWA